ncbi:MAG TPA: fatty acid desaturase CarF family protein [Opitutales bacterium]|nr:fatty acid desaturase CarF family protein [Opitutales bacterium]
MADDNEVVNLNPAFTLMPNFITILSFLCKILATVLAADFVAGFVHWLEDAYAREDTPILGPLVARANIIHHHYPRHFTRLSWWQSSWDLLCLCALLVLAAWATGLLTWEVWLFAMLTTNANQIHKWAHRTRKENGPVISFLQDIHLVQTPRHHALHHTNPKECHYCTTTNLLNPILDGLRFWEGLECLLENLLGIHRRVDTSVPGHGPAPAWLHEIRRKEQLISKSI